MWLLFSFATLCQLAGFGIGFLSSLAQNFSLLRSILFLILLLLLWAGLFLNRWSRRRGAKRGGAVAPAAGTSHALLCCLCLASWSRLESDRAMEL